jgi:hypothetical protein
VSFAAITLCVASQRVFIVVVVVVATAAYFVIDSVRKLLEAPSYRHNELASLRRAYSTGEQTLHVLA